MYGIFTYIYGIFIYIYHKHQPNVGKYTIHGSYGVYLGWWHTFLFVNYIGTRRYICLMCWRNDKKLHIPMQQERQETRRHKFIPKCWSKPKKRVFYTRKRHKIMWEEDQLPKRVAGKSDMDLVLQVRWLWVRSKTWRKTWEDWWSQFD